ncbi:MAG: CehA/McbA family metallohydrolase, partial [Planctomycetes bacterium]|nr:CehA/McbA family metallohydrolase [Planctomycetota bacterium]
MSLRIALCLTCLLAIAASGFAHEPTAPTCRLKLELVDGSSGKPLPGIVRIMTEDGKAVRPVELINRGQGINGQVAIHDWSVLPESATISLPAAPLVIAALSGLETDLAERRIDLTGKRKAELRIPLARFTRARAAGYVAGNTHLHLMKLSRKQADRYLKEVPVADGLDVVFISYLERAVADLEYTSNKYTPSDLAQLAHGHLHFGHGEEHRHNFGPGGEGYGHILLLDIPYIVQPVSIGPGIMLSGTDSPPLQAGIDEARSAGGKVIWAHNLFGFEDIPNWITGRVHANNIFDGSHRGSYKDTYYRYLNIGLRVPFSTGTDWFIYDFSRVYVPIAEPLTTRRWREVLATGRSYITNGPFLEFTVDRVGPGHVVALEKPGRVRIDARVVGRVDFERIELVQNGRVVQQAASRAVGGHFLAQLTTSLEITGPC